MGTNRNQTNITTKALASKITQRPPSPKLNICSECRQVPSSERMVREPTSKWNISNLSNLDRETNLLIIDKTAKFVNKSNVVHNNKYQYDLTNYINSKTKVTITCKIHGNFQQRPNDHLSGRGCKRCSTLKATYTVAQWINIFKHHHQDQYNYTFNTSNPKYVTIHCKQHNYDSVLLRSNVAAGHGPMCCKSALLRQNYQKSTIKFITEANKRHQFKYDYAETNYINTHSKVKIGCKIHGNFLQTPLNHLRGAGCKQCASAARGSNSTGGYTHRRFKTYPELKIIPARLYIIRAFNDSETFVKIGITSKSTRDRFKFNSVFPYNYTILLDVPNTLFICFTVEQIVKKQLKNFRYRPQIKFNGISECFISVAEDQVVNFVNRELSF